MSNIPPKFVTPLGSGTARVATERQVDGHGVESADSVEKQTGAVMVESALCIAFIFAAFTFLADFMFVSEATTVIQQVAREGALAMGDSPFLLSDWNNDGPDIISYDTMSDADLTWRFLPCMNYQIGAPSYCGHIIAQHRVRMMVDNLNLFVDKSTLQVSTTFDGSLVRVRVRIRPNHLFSFFSGMWIDVTQTEPYLWTNTIFLP